VKVKKVKKSLFKSEKIAFFIIFFFEYELLNKNVILNSFIYHFEANFMLSLIIELFFIFGDPLTSFPGLTAG